VEGARCNYPCWIFVLSSFRTLIFSNFPVSHLPLPHFHASHFPQPCRTGMFPQCLRDTASSTGVLDTEQTFKSAVNIRWGYLANSDITHWKLQNKQKRLYYTQQHIVHRPHCMPHYVTEMDSFVTNETQDYK